MVSRAQAGDGEPASIHSCRAAAAHANAVRSAQHDLLAKPQVICAVLPLARALVRATARASTLAAAAASAAVAGTPFSDAQKDSEVIGVHDKAHAQRLARRRGRNMGNGIERTVIDVPATVTSPTAVGKTNRNHAVIALFGETPTKHE